MAAAVLRVRDDLPSLIVRFNPLTIFSLTSILSGSVLPVSLMRTYFQIVRKSSWP